MTAPERILGPEVGDYLGLPLTDGATEVTAFLSSLAAHGVSASTQNQALSAILFLYEVVTGHRLPWMHHIVRAQRPARLPVVLSREEVVRLLAKLRGSAWLMKQPSSAVRCIGNCRPRDGWRAWGLELLTQRLT